MPEKRKRRKADKKRSKKSTKTTYEPREQDNSDVESIYYVDDEGGQIDMTTIDRKRKRGAWIALFFVIVAVLSAVTYFGYRVFQQGTNTDDGGVEFTLSVDEKVASGDIVTIEVSYINNKSVALAEGSVELFYPQGFYVQNTSEEAVDENQRVWNFENVAPGTGDTIRVTGQLVGSAGDTKDISALLTYQPSNFSQNFQESAERTVEITSSIITMETEAPDQVQEGQEFDVAVSYTNSSSAALKNVKLALNYPEGFVFTEADVPPTSGNSEWRIEELAPNETETIAITGTLSGESGDVKEIQAEFGIIEIDNSFTVQVEQTVSVVIVNPEIELFISAPENAEPGAGVPLTVSVNNTSEVEMKDVQVRLDFSGPYFREDTYDFEPIDLLLPNSTFDLEYTPILKDKASGSNFEMKVKAVAVSAIVEGNTVELPNEAEVNLKVSGALQANAYGRYFDDNLKKVGDGPIPPTVGETTTYQIVWTIEPSVNEMRSISMTTTLPDGVEWEDDASKAISFSSSTNQVTYEKDALPPEDERTVFFTVSVTPEKSDVDSLLVLTEQTILSAVDSLTKDNITVELDRITTDLPQDEGAAGKGVVVQ